MVPHISNELIAWADQAGMSYLDLESRATVGFSSGGGEYRYYVRRSVDEPGWLTVTKASRDDEERFLFSARDMDVVERYFWATFGADIRSALRQPRLAFPTEPENIADGYSLLVPSEGKAVLTDPAGHPILTTRYGITYLALLVMVSHLLGWSESDLELAFRDPNGQPVFPIRSRRQSDENLQ